MLKPAEAGNVPDSSVRPVEEVRVELVSVEQLPASNAAVVIRAQAIDLHHHPGEVGTGIKAFTSPIFATSALDKTIGNARIIQPTKSV